MASKVFVGLSGGVDSAVSAALLVQQGYDVIGVFIKIWSPEFLECTWREDRLDAMRVCVALGIPFREIDLSNAYRDEVVDTMISEYKRGVTPNPDVLCNERVKFGHFAQWAFENGAEMIATGHYARVEAGVLMRAVDPTKDQSYFLYRIRHDVLLRTLFPIGDMHKKDVRALAQKFNLPVARKPDSQGLCFVGEVSLREFIGRFLVLDKGDVIDGSDTVIGRHDGAILYTLGQRHGFILNGAQDMPHYVVGIDTHLNLIHVSTDKTDAYTTTAHLRDCHWIDDPPELPQRLQAQTRYHGEIIEVTLTEAGKVHFAQLHLATPGQSLVLYRGDTCIGGGVIASLKD